MYFPYLRGRQYELIAIRELAEQGKMTPYVMPIIEPVNLTSTLSSTIKSCEDRNTPCAIILNPQVGALAGNSGGSKELLSLMSQKSNVVKTIVAAEDSKKTYDALIEQGEDSSRVMGIYLDRDYISDYEQVFDKKTCYNVVPYDSAFRRIRNKRVLISDRFNAVKKERNKDYANKVDEFYSDDHLFYEEDGYIGFSDYSIVGEEYQVTGFAPYAVAIHIVYFDEESNLRIRHFVSDSNDDISDPGNKFYEAVTKLVEWNKTMRLDTIGIKAFEKLQEEGAYPGLGVVKKLAIMHHLELMGKYLERRKHGIL